MQDSQRLVGFEKETEYIMYCKYILVPPLLSSQMCCQMSSQGWTCIIMQSDAAEICGSAKTYLALSAWVTIGYLYSGFLFISIISLSYLCGSCDLSSAVTVWSVLNHSDHDFYFIFWTTVSQQLISSHHLKEQWTVLICMRTCSCSMSYIKMI